VAVFDPGTGTGRLLALDLDPARVGGSAAEVDAQADALEILVARAGGRCLTDTSPSGGRHLFIVFAGPLPWRELRDMARALVVRFPAIDPVPMASLGGQISPPGSRHKSGGWRLLSMPPEDAAAVVEHPNRPEVWDALLAELVAELRRVEPVEPCGDVPDGAELDGGVPWLPRLGGRVPLGAELEHVARTGRWGHTRHPGRSEARMAVLMAAAARGWRLADVRAAVSRGAWKGFAQLYARTSEPGRLDRLLPLEWRKCVGKLSGEKNVPTWLTSVSTSRPPAPTGGADEFGLIRQWVTGTDCAAGDPERVRRWGRRAVAVRQLLAAIGQAAMVTGSAVIEHGTRNLALHAGLSQRTVSRLLRMLYEEPDPLLDVVSRGRMARADRIALRIPDQYADSVRWRRWRAGRVEAIHPVFLVLGGTAGLVYQALDQVEARGAEVARAARLSASAASAALRVLAEHGLAERGPGGWRRGAVGLADVAESTGAADLQRERETRYRQDRESWRARLRQYQGAKRLPVTSRDGWWPLDDEDEYDEMCRWPVILDDGVRAPPAASRASETA
jgi:DNA-binding transcriptional ArsR family regulator